jgi:hypothetical protein
MRLTSEKVAEVIRTMGGECPHNFVGTPGGIHCTCLGCEVAIGAEELAKMGFVHAPDVKLSHVELVGRLDRAEARASELADECGMLHTSLEQADRRAGELLRLAEMALDRTLSPARLSVIRQILQRTHRK